MGVRSDILAARLRSGVEAHMKRVFTEGATEGASLMLDELEAWIAARRAELQEDSGEAPASSTRAGIRVIRAPNEK